MYYVQGGLVHSAGMGCNLVEKNIDFSIFIKFFQFKAKPSFERAKTIPETRIGSGGSDRMLAIKKRRNKKHRQPQTLKKYLHMPSYWVKLRSHIENLFPGYP